MAATNTVTIIGPGTRLTGHVMTKDAVIIAGYIEGDVTAGSVVVKDGGCVMGNITCSSLVIEAGGVFDGQASMRGSSGSPVSVNETT